MAQNRGDIKATEMFLSFHGLLLPKETHDPESLKFAQDFTFKDNDVLAVTYPKSGQCFFSLKHADVARVNMSNSSHTNYGKKTYVVITTSAYSLNFEIIYLNRMNACISCDLHFVKFRLHVKIVTRVKH